MVQADERLLQASTKAEDDVCLRLMKVRGVGTWMLLAAVTQHVQATVDSVDQTDILIGSAGVKAYMDRGASFQPSLRASSLIALSPAFAFSLQSLHPSVSSLCTPAFARLSAAFVFRTSTSSSCCPIASLVKAGSNTLTRHARELLKEALKYNGIIPVRGLSWYPTRAPSPVEFLWFGTRIHELPQCGSSGCHGSLGFTRLTLPLSRTLSAPCKTPYRTSPAPLTSH